MKQVLLPLILLVAPALTYAENHHQHSHIGEKVTVEKIARSTRTIEIEVHGLVCDFCAQSLEKTLGKQEAVKEMAVDLKKGTIVLSLNQNLNISDTRIKQLINDSGIAVTKIKR